MQNRFLRTNETQLVRIPHREDVQIFIKREDLIHAEISGNKFWKLFYNIENYLAKNPDDPQIVTFGGAFSNHIFAVAALGKQLNINTLGIIRGEELREIWQANPTLEKAAENGMRLRFVSRSDYRNQEKLSRNLQIEFPGALILPEGGTNNLAIEGIKLMLNDATKLFDFICCAVGTGGTLAGISKFAEPNQKVLGFNVVKDSSLERKILRLSGRENFQLIDASELGYGKISDKTVLFINNFYDKFEIPLDPIYTGKMFRKVFSLLEKGYFPAQSRILIFHTGGLQAIAGANQRLKRHGRNTINFRHNV